MKIKIIRGKYKGTVHEARKVPKLTPFLSDYQIIEGELQGVLIDYMDCIVVDEGKTYTEAQYSEQVKKVTKLEEDRTQLLKEINVLKADKELLLETIEEEERNSKVELPREVAEAIERVSAMFNNYGILKRFFLGLTDERYHTEENQTLFNYINNIDDGLNNILKALVNGYTVKDEQAELEEQVYKMIDVWMDEEYQCGEAEEDMKRFASKLTNFFKENL